MEITEVRIKLMEDSDDRLQGFCSVTFDNCFVVRDLKIIEGTNGPFVAMPSRKLTSHCSTCGAKNHLRAGYCNHCGAKQKEERMLRDHEGRTKLYADIAHPINSLCREMIQSRVISEYQGELEKAKQPGYLSRYDEDYAFDAGEDYCGPIDQRSVAIVTETRVDRPHLAEAEPRAPHRMPIAAGTSDEVHAPHQKPVRQRGEFGAGLFE